MSTEQKDKIIQAPIVVKSVEILTSLTQVWHALTEPDKIRQWMGGAQVKSKWELGTNITLTGKMPNFDETYRDRGLVLAVEREKFLQYSHWSAMTRLPDSPQNRSIITFVLDWFDEKTRLTVRHENFHSKVEFKHANFFWGSALVVLKNLLEQEAH